MEFGMHEYTLEQRIEEVKLCVHRQVWQSVLALALTIPDICGQIKFSNLKISNRKGEEINMCYHLRCAFLHSGDDSTIKTGSKNIENH